MKIEGKKVEDANKKLRITIGNIDVKAGALKNAKSCAAAVSLVRQGFCDAARVHVFRTYLKKGNKWLRYKTPPALRNEIIAFDRGGKFEPGDYELSPIPPSDRTTARTAARKANKTVRKSHKSKGIRKPHVITGVRQRMTAGGKIV